ncbi:hypothetical protein H0H87_001563 [Tephrocybe sp. NHM501043]|nr:hypothetical protein H0H87_001563 [Tephrocybe sp. NHM501043]
MFIPTERTNAHHPAAPIIPWATGPQIPRVEALLGRREHLLRAIEVNHGRVDPGLQERNGTQWERPGRVRDTGPGDCVQAVKGEVVDGVVGNVNKVRGGAGGGRGEKAD